jgi:hypothetical protein
LTLDRMGETTAAAVGISFIGGFSKESLIDSVYRIDIAARWRIAAWELYAQFAWNHIAWAVDRIPGTNLFLNDFTGATDFEVGAAYTIGVPEARLYLRTGVILPTASNLQFDANVGGSYARWTDFATMLPGTLWLRPGLTLRGAFGDDFMFFYQADATVCIPFHTSDDYPENDAVWVVNAAVGAALGRVEATAELVNAVADVTYRSLAFTASYRFGETGKFRPYLGVVFPFVPDASTQAHVVSLGVNGLW